MGSMDRDVEAVTGDGDALPAVLAAIAAADALVFRTGRGFPGGEIEVIGAGAARLSEEQTIVVTTVISPQEGERLAAERGVGAGELASFLSGLATQPLCWWFVHGRRWTWLE